MGVAFRCTSSGVGRQLVDPIISTRSWTLHLHLYWLYRKLGVGWAAPYAFTRALHTCSRHQAREPVPAKLQLDVLYRADAG